MSRTGSLLLKGGGLRVISVAVQMVIGFLMMPFMVQHLGDQLYGIWAVVGGIIGAYYLLDLGFTSAVVRYVAQHIHERNHEKTNQIVSTAFAIYLVISIVVLLITVVIAILSEHFVHDVQHGTDVKWLICLMGLTMALNFPFNAFAGIANAYLRYDLGVYSRLFFSVCTSLMYAFLITHGYKLLALAATNVVMSLLSDFVFVSIARHLHPTLSVAFRYVSKEAAQTLFDYSVWAFISNISATIRQGLDSMVIAANLSAAAVTHYTVGYRLVEYATQLQWQATNILGPLFTRYYASGNSDELRDKVILMTKINSLLACYCTWMLALLGGNFIHVWMGSQYDDSYTLLCVLAVGFGAHLTFNPLSNAMFAIAKPKFIAQLDIVEAVLNLVLSLILVRVYGMLGVAIGTMIPLVGFALGARPFIACRQLHMSVKRYYRAVLPMAAFSALLALVSLRWVQPRLPLNYASLFSVALGVFPFYAIMVVKLFFSRSEMAILLNQIPTALQPWARRIFNAS